MASPSPRASGTTTRRRSLRTNLAGIMAQAMSRSRRSSTTAANPSSTPGASSDHPSQLAARQAVAAQVESSPASSPFLPKGGSLRMSSSARSNGTVPAGGKSFVVRSGVAKGSNGRSSTASFEASALHADNEENLDRRGSLIPSLRQSRGSMEKKPSIQDSRSRDDGIAVLLQAKQWDSAEMLATLTLKSTTEAKEKIRLFEHLMEALIGKRDWNRVLSAGKRALAECIGNETDLAGVNWRMMQGHMGLDQAKDAVKAGESIPIGSRPLSVHMALGKLYMELRVDRAAVSCFKEALTISNDALEAVGALSRLGVPSGEILRLTQSSKHPWITCWCEGLSALSKGSFTVAEERFQSLIKDTGESALLLATLARAQGLGSHPERALVTWARVRVLDSTWITGMDEFALLLTRRGALAELNALVASLLRLSTSRPEPWVAAALYALGSGEAERALQLVEKALTVDSSHVGATLTKGRILLSSGLAEPAVAVYRRLNGVERSPSVYAGLVEALLALQRFKDAQWWAEEAIRVLPNHVATLTLKARVIGELGDTEESIKILEKALRISKSYWPAMDAIVDRLVAKGRAEQAVAMLREHGDNGADTAAKLGDVLVLTRDFEEALLQYHTAISICPGHSTAVAGLEQLEGWMAAGEQGTRSHLSTVNTSVDLSMNEEEAELLM